MNIELTADQAAAFERGESITLTPPTKAPVRTNRIAIDTQTGATVHCVDEDGKTVEYRVLRFAHGGYNTDKWVSHTRYDYPMFSLYGWVQTAVEE